MKTTSDPGSTRTLRAPFRILAERLGCGRDVPLLLAFLFALLPFASPAQEGPPRVGFIRFVNAVAPGQGNTHVKIGGDEMFPKGYTLGQRTGGIGLKAGSHKISVTKQGTEPGETEVDVVNGETVTLVAFAEKLPAEDDKPERWGIRIIRLKQRDTERGFRLTMLNVSREQELSVETLIQGRDKPEFAGVKRFMTSTVDLGGSGGDISVRLLRSEEILASFRPDDPGNYVLLLYEGEEGDLRALYFYDPKFVIAG